MCVEAYWGVLGCIGICRCIAECVSMCRFVQMCGGVFWDIEVCRYVLVCAGMCWYVLGYVRMYCSIFGHAGVCVCVC